MHGTNRFALGWYLSKCGSAITSLLVIVSLFYDIARLYRRSFESEARYRLLADASSDIVSRIDLHGRCRYVSPAATEILGYGVAELTGTRPVDFIHPEDKARVAASSKELSENRKDQVRNIHRVRHKAGHWIWAEAQLRLVRDKSTGVPIEIVSNLRDVTERETLHHRLKEANRFLNLAEEIAHVGHWRVELPEYTLTWSSEVYRIHGRDPDTFWPDVASAIALYHPEDRADVDRCLTEAIAGCGNFSFALRILRPDGEVRHVLSRGVCEADAAGEVKAIFGTIMDVTELRLAERVAQESEARYRLLADHSGDLIALKPTVDGRCAYVSPASRSVVGYEPDEFAALTSSQLIHPDDTERVAAEFSSLSIENSKITSVHRVRHKAGHWIWLEVDFRLTNPGEQPGQSVIVRARDISARREAERALATSEGRYRFLAETTSDVITQLDMTLQRQYVSPSCRRIFGYEPDEMLGVRPSAKIHPDDAAKVKGLTAQLAAGTVAGDRITMTYRTLHKQGHWIWIEAAINLVREEETGAPLSLICSLRDVTERQVAAAQLELAKAAAEQAARAKSDFVANMSHELRTPLTGILGVHDLLGKDPSLNDKQKRLVHIAGDAGRSLLTIVNDVLDFSKIEAGQMEIEAVAFDVDAIIASCADLAGESVKSKPVQILTRSPPGGLGHFVGDPTRIRQVLLNLLTNAVKFTPRGQVAINATFEKASGLLRIDVIDSGIGIPSDRIASLFERFAQADTTMTRRYGGTGLGLAICKRLVELMNGRIGVEVPPNGGSNFWFELPLERHMHSRIVPNDHAVAGGKSARRLLLAEDNRVNAEIIGAMLEACGHTVSIVPDGARAAEAACQEPAFDLILMDLQMPGMDGLSATAAIRAHEAKTGRPRIPVVGLTANAMIEDVERCLAGGMDAHVAKPIAWAGLFATLDRLLGSSRSSLFEGCERRQISVLPASDVEELAIRQSDFAVAPIG